MLDEAIKIGKLLAARGLIDGASGNLSFKKGNRIFITKSGECLDDLNEDSFVGISLTEYNKEASVDQDIHKEIYKKTNYSAVLHCHGVYNVALSFKLKNVKPIDLEGSIYFGEISIVSGEFGSEDLQNKIVEKIRDKGAVIVRGHGIYAAGKSLRDAFNKACYIEHSCQILFLNLLLNKLKN
ncbi:fructose-bisphosphate aldolase [Archaeoglobales archaeon ex4484_92]|nr:MAG: fructose-bisphosphate aldolase [Archaeoglobales archaeon ex4484_92]